MTKSNLKKTAPLFLTLLLAGQLGCSTGTSTTTPTQTKLPDTNTTSSASNGTTNQQNDNQVKFSDLTNILLTETDASGAVNPVTPDEIEYISVDGTIIKGSDISIVGENSFSTKGWFDGIGAFFSNLLSINNPPKKTAPAPSVVAVKTKTSPVVYTIPVIPDYGSNIRANIQGNTVTGGYIPAKAISDNGAGLISPNGGTLISPNGGTLISPNGASIVANNSSRLTASNGIVANNTSRFELSSPMPYKGTTDLFDFKQCEAIFTSSSASSNITIFSADGSQYVYNDKLSNPVKTSISQELFESTKANMAVGLQVLSPISPYVGSWNYKLNMFGLNEEIKLQVYETANNKFSVGTVFKGQTYTGTGDNVETNGAFELNAGYSNISVRLRLKNEGTNRISLTLLNSGGVSEVAPFVNMPFMLNRDTAAAPRSIVLK
jgi:hypothetical protein